MRSEKEAILILVSVIVRRLNKMMLRGSTTLTIRCWLNAQSLSRYGSFFLILILCVISSIDPLVMSKGNSTDVSPVNRVPRTGQSYPSSFSAV